MPKEQSSLQTCCTMLYLLCWSPWGLVLFWIPCWRWSVMCTHWHTVTSTETLAGKALWQQWWSTAHLLLCGTCPSQQNSSRIVAIPGLCHVDCIICWVANRGILCHCRGFLIVADATPNTNQRGQTWSDHVHANTLSDVVIWRFPKLGYPKPSKIGSF
jgi:hypothetical protein